MISRIGSKLGRAPNKTLLLNYRFCSGFTLVEVMVATAVLSLGIVLLYEAFFKITDAFGYYNHYISVSPFAREKIWAAQDAFSKSGDQASVEASGKLAQRGQDFTWNVSYSLLDEAPNSLLYKIDLVIVWKEGLRNGKLLR